MSGQEARAPGPSQMTGELGLQQARRCREGSGTAWDKGNLPGGLRIAMPKDQEAAADQKNCPHLPEALPTPETGTAVGPGPRSPGAS